MELIKDFIDFILHLDKHLVELVRDYGTFTYAILFAIVFCETGLVVTPFLPGDSLLFVAGTLAATGGELDAQGNRVSHTVLAAEKSPASFTFEVTNPGGHSSRPVPDNAIYHLIRAVDRVSRYEFPVQLNDANRAYYGKPNLTPTNIFEGKVEVPESFKPLNTALNKQAAAGDKK